MPDFLRRLLVIIDRSYSCDATREKMYGYVRSLTLTILPPSSRFERLEKDVKGWSRI